MTNDIEMIYLANVICKGKDLVNASKIWKFVFHILSECFVLEPFKL